MKKYDSLINYLNSSNIVTKPFNDFWDILFYNKTDDKNTIFQYNKHIGGVNVIENDKNYIIEVNVPGFKKENITVQVEKGFLNICGEYNESKEDENKNYTRKEFCKKSFNRTFTLPENIDDNFQATLNDGILKIVANKKTIEEKENIKNIIIE